MGAAESSCRKGDKQNQVEDGGPRDGGETRREARFFHMALATFTLRQVFAVQAL